MQAQGGGQDTRLGQVGSVERVIKNVKKTSRKVIKLGSLTWHRIIDTGVKDVLANNDN